MSNMTAMRTYSGLVADGIRAELARRRISYAALAEYLGTSQTSVSRRLSGDVPIDLNELAAIAGFLTVPLDALVVALPTPTVSAS